MWMKKEEKQNQMEPKPPLLKTKRVKTDLPLATLTKTKAVVLVAEGGAEEIVTGEAELLLLEEVDHEEGHIVEVEEAVAVSQMLPVTIVSRPAIWVTSAKIQRKNERWFVTTAMERDICRENVQNHRKNDEEEVPEALWLVIIAMVRDIRQESALNHKKKDVPEDLWLVTIAKVRVICRESVLNHKSLEVVEEEVQAAEEVASIVVTKATRVMNAVSHDEDVEEVEVAEATVGEGAVEVAVGVVEAEEVVWFLLMLKVLTYQHKDQPQLKMMQPQTKERMMMMTNPKRKQRSPKNKPLTPMILTHLQKIKPTKMVKIKMENLGLKKKKMKQKNGKANLLLILKILKVRTKMKKKKRSPKTVILMIQVKIAINQQRKLKQPRK
jgi:hypothetical protein